MTARFDSELRGADVPVYAFVDGPSSSPTVLFDLDAQEPFSVVVGTSTSPPQRRVSSFGSSARDGDVLAQKAYQDRQLAIRLRFELGTTAEEQSEGIQTLARLLDGPQWLMWQSDAKIEPVFYRTKFGDIEVDDSMLTDTPTRYVSLSIAAEPFGYGLPVSGSAVIDNDPTSGTNKMSYLFPDIQGDVATPLWLKVSQNATTWETILSTTCMPVGVTGGAPVVTGAFDISISAGTRWLAASSAADATAISGFRKRWTRDSVVLNATGLVTLGTSYLANVPRGDYRLLVRVRSSSSTSTITGWISDPSLSIDLSSQPKPLIPGTTWGWVDLGVVRAPGFGPRQTALLDQAHDTRTYLTFYITAANDVTIDFDELMLVPAGLDAALDTRTAIVGGDLTGTDDLFVDGVNEQTYLRVESTDTMAPATMVGSGFPRVVPNADCRLNFVRLINTAGDDKALDTTINWTYLPQYLYDRPASS